MIPTLMLSPQYGEDSNRLQAAAVARAWNVVRWSNWQLPPGLQTEGAFLYSSALFAERVSQLTGLQFPEPPVEWLASLPEELVKRNIEESTLTEARSLARKAFYKPAAFKAFRAGVYDSGAELPSEDEADGQTPVLISEVVHWRSEFRFFLLDGKALTGSIYYRDGKSGQVQECWPSGAEEFERARETAERAFLAVPGLLNRSVVIDTGYIDGLGWAVIEANPSWGSGLYGSEPNKVLDVLQASVVS